MGEFCECSPLFFGSGLKGIFSALKQERAHNVFQVLLVDYRNNSTFPLSEQSPNRDYISSVGAISESRLHFLCRSDLRIVTTFPL